MKKQGQALIEFIIILPIIIVFLLAIVDFSIIFTKKNALENTLDEVVELKKNNNEEKIKSLINDDNIKIDIKNEDEKIEIILKENYNVMTPGLNLILNNPFEIKVSRVILNE